MNRHSRGISNFHSPPTLVPIPEGSRNLARGRRPRDAQGDTSTPEGVAETTVKSGFFFIGNSHFADVALAALQLKSHPENYHAHTRNWSMVLLECKGFNTGTSQLRRRQIPVPHGVLRFPRNHPTHPSGLPVPCQAFLTLATLNFVAELPVPPGIKTTLLSDSLEALGNFDT